jgi:hypothetical protein
MRKIWLVGGLMATVVYCQPGRQDVTPSIRTAVVLATVEDQEYLSALRVVAEHENWIPLEVLTRWSKQHGFLVLSASSQKDIVYLISNRVLQSGIDALQQLMPYLEAGNPVPISPGNLLCNTLETFFMSNEYVRFRDFSAFVRRYESVSVMLSGEIVAEIKLPSTTYTLDIDQLYKVSKNDFSLQDNPNSDQKNKHKDESGVYRNDEWVIHFVGFVPHTDKERCEFALEAFMLLRQRIELEEQMRNQFISSIIRRMEQLLHDRETIEAGRQYSIRDLPPRWQEIIRRSLAERGFSQHEVDAQVQFRVVPGLQFLLQNGAQRRVMGIRLTETRVFFYTVDGTGQ